MICFDVCKCKLPMSSAFSFLLPPFPFKVTCKSGGAGFQDLKLYACIYQNGKCDYNKITYLRITYYCNVMIEMCKHTSITRTD